jgi:hypothetical protein
MPVQTVSLGFAPAQNTGGSNGLYGSGSQDHLVGRNEVS